MRRDERSLQVKLLKRKKVDGPGGPGKQGVRTLCLNAEKVLKGYDAVSALYPHVPPLSHWRAWEYAAYQGYTLHGRILDLGCGDGQYFRLLWPHVSDVTGVDMDPVVAELAGQSGVYRVVHTTTAEQVPEPRESFDCVFANCSLEHMDHLDDVLAEVCRCLKPGGCLLCSVVTDRFVHWTLLPGLVRMAGFTEAAAGLKDDYMTYHHLANALSVTEWQERLAQAGLTAEEHVPILPMVNSGMFLFMDSLWHVKRLSGGEMGDVIFSFLSANQNFPGAFGKVLSGLLDMETDWEDCSGAVFLARKAR